jgi:hypothetical protein
MHNRPNRGSRAVAYAPPTKIIIKRDWDILPNRDQLFEDEIPIFLTSINMFQKVKKVLRFFTSNWSKW